MLIDYYGHIRSVNNFLIYVLDVPSKPKNSRKRLSSDSLPTLDPNLCNGSKKSKLETKAISLLVAYGSDSSDEENEIPEDSKSTILQRLQEKAELFKQKELDKLNHDKSILPKTHESNGQPDIFDIIGKEVPPDYTTEKPIVAKSSENKTTGDIFEILKSEVPPDYMDDTKNNIDKEDIKLDVASESTENEQVNVVEKDFKSKYHSNSDEKTKHTTLNSCTESSTKPFNLIASYGEEDLDESGNVS